MNTGKDTHRVGEHFRLILILASLICSGVGRVQGAIETETMMRLPETIGAWKQTEPPRRVEPAGIFDYMDGAGELYIGYRFKHVDVYDYTGRDNSQLLVEVYQMETSDDAFGLLSLDWGGEPVELTNEGGPTPRARALYGAGLLRIWSGDIYARLLAERETPESRKAVIELGKAMAAGRAHTQPPQLLGVLPPGPSLYSLAPGRSSYLRSYLVLNSVYYLSAQNILNLGLDCEAVTSSYRPVQAGDKQDARLVVIRYPDEHTARQALRSFRDAYLPGGKAGSRGAEGIPEISHVEDGWMGVRLVGSGLILVFQCPSQNIVESFLDEAAKAVQTLRGKP